MQTLTLDIAGHQLTVRSPADPGYVEELAVMLDARVSDARERGAGPIASVLLTALGLADELHRTKARVADAAASARRLAEAADLAERK